MFNPQEEQHREDCRCESAAHPSNETIPVEDIETTTHGYGERLRQSGERMRLAEDYARKLWARGFRGRCLWFNVLAMFEPASYAPEYNQWREIRNNIY